MSEIIQAAPIVKWVGGKRDLLPLLIPKLPSTWGRYFEPFMGGAAMFFELWSRCRLGQMVGAAVLNDANHRLVNCYRGLAQDVDGVIRELEALGADCSAAGYGRAVKEFNRYRPMPEGVLFAPKQLPLQRQAALLIYIIRLCFNGLYRENQAGAYNVGYCHDPGQFSIRPDELRVAALALRAAQVHAGDFEVVCLLAEPGDFIFFDPPYDGTFTSYSSAGFSALDQTRLAKLCRKLDLRGVKWLLTNNDTDTVRELWEGFEFIPTEETRSVNSDGEKRGAVPCVAIRNYQE